MKKLFPLVLLMVLLCTGALASGSNRLGKPLEDFSVDTIDGGCFTLSEELTDHDLVLINLWASWCAPCEMEFPYLEEAYEAYNDRVAVIALSVETGDTPEVLTEYAAEHGLTFPLGSDSETNLMQYFNTGSVPTSIAVDRFGNVAFVETGARMSAEPFVNLFDYFLDEGYTQTAVLNSFPEGRAGAEPADAYELAEAANVPGGMLVFSNDVSPYVWPMLPEETDGRLALASSNAEAAGTRAAICVDVIAAEGDVLAFDFRTSTEPMLDVLSIDVDGKTLKRFTGEHEWTSWAIPLETGAHEIRFIYSKDSFGDVGEDRVWIDNVRLAGGSEAVAACRSLPGYPVADAFSVTVANEGARRIEIEPLWLLFKDVAWPGVWVANDDTARIEVALTAEYDPEMALVHNGGDGTVIRLTDALSPGEEDYVMSVPLRDEDGSRPGYTALYVYPDVADTERYAVALVFADEETAGSFFAAINGQGYPLKWHYAD